VGPEIKNVGFIIGANGILQIDVEDTGGKNDGGGKVLSPERRRTAHKNADWKDRI